MWPRYPKQASRGPRSLKTAHAILTSKRAAGKRWGPSVTKSWTMTAPTAASAEATRSVPRQGSSVRPRTRWGVAEPLDRERQRTVGDDAEDDARGHQGTGRADVGEVAERARERARDEARLDGDRETG